MLEYRILERQRIVSLHGFSVMRVWPASGWVNPCVKVQYMPRLKLPYKELEDAIRYAG